MRKKEKAHQAVPGDVNGAQAKKAEVAFREVDCWHSTHQREGKWAGAGEEGGAEDGLLGVKERMSKAFLAMAALNCVDDVLSCHKYTATDRERIR